MRPPVIAVSGYYLPPGRVRKWERGAVAAPESYIAALERAGALAAIIRPIGMHADEALGIADGLLLLGGGDVDPTHYGQDPHDEVYGLDPHRDHSELDLIREAVRADLPTLAICRGAQVLNVAFGGTLHQHLPDAPGFGAHGAPAGKSVMHDVKLDHGSRLQAASGVDRAAVWSSHHQGVDRLGEDLHASAWTDDGLVEGLEHRFGWVVAVQWHPEETAADDPAQQALFGELVARASAR
jgi:gamma-glutamyl-gamma-aminobutyrate hydrolase PuuD